MAIRLDIFQNPSFEFTEVNWDYYLDAILKSENKDVMRYKKRITFILENAIAEKMSDRFELIGKKPSIKTIFSRGHHFRAKWTFNNDCRSSYFEATSYFNEKSYNLKVVFSTGSMYIQNEHYQHLGFSDEVFLFSKLKDITINMEKLMVENSKFILEGNDDEITNNSN